MNKTIYMTFKNHDFPKDKVFNYWLELNPDWKIEFSDDNDCIEFILKHFGQEHVDLFNHATYGANKSDIWRLCKLYVEGGVYADIDIIPYVSIEEMVDDSNFCTCKSIVDKSLFQAFMYVSDKQNLIIKECLQSLLDNKYNYKWDSTEPTFDMYDTMLRMGFNVEVGTALNNNIKIRILEEYYPEMTWEDCLLVTSGGQMWMPRVRLNGKDVMKSKDREYEMAKKSNTNWL